MFNASEISKLSLSSSPHLFNADFPMRGSDKLMYFVANLWSNLMTRFGNKKINLVKFTPSQTVIENHVEALESIISPSRILCNIFWENLDWDWIKAQLARELRVVEVGCGSGRYGEKLKRSAGITSYLGIDIEPHEQWKINSSNEFDFQIGSYENFLSLVHGQNLIITQSAIEHFEQDILFFNLVREYAESCDFPVIAIHLFPSPACLPTMLLHGIRQYNRRSIAKLVKVSGNTQCRKLYVLGGFRTNFFHFFDLTLRSLVLRKPLATKGVNQYLSKASRVLARDSESASKLSPSFYALILSWKTEDDEKDWIKGAKSSP
jgi:SAM-dependent methyltransferase